MMHTPVLLNEVMEYLNPKPGQKFIDATVDGGGHAMAILEKITSDGKLLGIEWDGELLEQLRIKKQELGIKDKNLVLINDSYVNLKKIAEENDFTDADGIFFDFGMSSWHLEEAGRGFTFMKEEMLDMRFDSSFNIKYQISKIKNNVTAGEIVNKWSYDDLVKILKKYGEERFAKSIATNIIKARKEKLIKTTFELVEIVKSSMPFWYKRGRLHFATKTFQALRIAVNNELENMKSGLEQSLKVMKIGGRIAAISFHSLEDRIVKNFLRDKVRMGRLAIITKKPIGPGLIEKTKNQRARSAKLRVAEKIV